MQSTILAIAGLGWQELLIILVIAMLLFGGTRLAGIGKSSGRAIREFKEETRGLKEDERKAKEAERAKQAGTADRSLEAHGDQPIDAEIVEPQVEKNPDDQR